MKKIKVYIAAPYTSDPCHNTYNVIQVANQLFDKGYIPYVPHLTLLWDVISPRPVKDWYKLDNEWLECCDCIIRLAGKSKGADNEMRLARKLGVKITTLKKLLNRNEAQYFIV